MTTSILDFIQTGALLAGVMFIAAILGELHLIRMALEGKS